MVRWRGAEEFKGAVFDGLAVADVATVFVFFVDEGWWLVSGAAPACAGEIGGTGIGV